MKKVLKLTNTQFFLIIGFVISTFSCSLILSSTYRFYNYIVDTNYFNKNNKFVSFSVKDPMSLIDAINLLQQKGINNMSTHRLTATFTYGDNAIVNNVIGALPGFNIEDYAHITGRNFTYNELNGKEKKAIIGNSLKKYTVKIDSRDYFKVYDDYYEVIGVIQNSNFYSTVTILPIRSLYFVDNKYTTFNQMVSNNEIEKLNNMSGIQIQTYPQVSVINYLIKNVPKLTDSLFQLALGIINIIFFSLFFAYDIKKRIAVMKVLGAKNIHVYKTILGSISIVSIVGILCGLILSKFTIDFMNSSMPNSYKPLDIYNILVTCCLTYLLSILISIVALFSTVKFKILKEIR